MKVRIIINTWVDAREGDELSNPWLIKGHRSSSEVWRGDLDLLEDNEYLTKISVIADGVAHPICDIPFAIGIGHWLWMPENTEELEEAPSLFVNMGKHTVEKERSKKWRQKLKNSVQKLHRH